MPGTSFDRVAEIYDQTRGGERRGGKFAAALAPWVVGTRVTELGVGTGVIAKGLLDQGVDITGFDLSAPMMLAALDRIGPRVAVADADRLPLADDSVDTVIFVWVLQLVDDAAATLTEAARVVRPGGRVIAILAKADDHPDDEIATILSGLAPIVGPGRGLDAVLAIVPPQLTLDFSGYTPWDSFPSVPNQQADMVEQRAFSSLFDVDDDTWEAVVVPVIRALRAMPNADREHHRRNRHPLVVWTAR